MSRRVFLLAILFAATATLAQSPPPPHVSVPPIPQITHHAPLPDSPAFLTPEDEAVPLTPETMPIEASYAESPSEKFQNALQRRMEQERGNDIHVQLADDGSATLEGRVSSQKERRRAEQIARSLASGHMVKNQILIRGNSRH